jgi:CheY-like chemotaxis protein/anti-sigma regulatory factor (Ser/Thr protein kinase)
MTRHDSETVVVYGEPVSTVLIVDDSPVDRHMAGRVVEKDASLKAAFAEHGAEALTSMERNRPAAVVTDMQMPVMDGLQLVEEIRSRFPTVPVILMTGHGSEEIAIRALQAGAASYVAKRFLARDLGPTLQQVMTAANTDRRQQRILDSITALECEFTIENDPSLVPMLVSHFQEYSARLKLCDESQQLRIGIALEEALLNGLYHGNLELSSELRRDGDDAFRRLFRERRDSSEYRNRKLYVRASLGHTQAVFVIRDDGPGFDPTSLPDPTDPANLAKESGRGLLLIRTFMDYVTHNAKGNEITLIKRRNVRKHRVDSA